MAERGFDVIIAGAGFVGLALAATFASVYRSLDLKIGLVDPRGAHEQVPQGADARAFALTASSRAMLRALGVWPALAPHAQEMREIKVTDSRPGAAARPTLLQFGETGGGGAPSAHVIESRHLVAALAARLAGETSVTRLYGAPVAAFAAQGAVARVTLGDGATLAAPLVVAADGRASPLRSMAGIDTVGWSYGQHGIVVTVAHERPHGGCAQEHFLPAGPFAILPLPGNRASLVWTEAQDKARALVAGSDADFRRELEQRFGAQLGSVAPEGPRMSFPLRLHIARAYAAERLALVGDAAHVVHPIAGLGFNLGLRDAAVLADEVVEAVKLGLDPGGASVLDAYQRRRRFDTLLVAAATDGLNRLFSNDNAAMRAVRDLGLVMVDKAGPLKRFFIDQAVGRNAPLPAIMRGE
jgi:2-octaprenyl-6-methoxyphenol hydroxylase